jgi:hypothetical protein
VRWLLTQMSIGAVRAIGGACLLAVALLLGITDLPDLIAGYFRQVEPWILTPYPRLAIMVVCVVLFLLLTFWDQLFSDPLARAHQKLVGNALDALNSNPDDQHINWLRANFAGGTPPDHIGKVLAELKLVGRDSTTGWSEVKSELKPIVARRLKSHNARWKLAWRSLFAKVEPCHLILIGIAGVIVFAFIALAGAILQMRKAPNVASAPSSSVVASADAAPATPPTSEQQVPPQWQAFVRERQIQELTKRLDAYSAQPDGGLGSIKTMLLRAHPDGITTMKDYRWHVDQWKLGASEIQSIARQTLGDDRIDVFDMSKFSPDSRTDFDQSLRARHEQGELTFDEADSLVRQFRQVYYLKQRRDNVLRETRSKLEVELKQVQQIINEPLANPAK